MSDEGAPGREEPVEGQWPTSGAPHPWTPTSAPPQQVNPWAAEPAFVEVAPPGQRRIIPSPRPSRPRWLVGAVVGGGVLSLLLAAFLGYLVGAATKSEEPPVAQSPPTAATEAPYDVLQAELYKPKFDGDLAPVAEPWLPRLSFCVADGDVGGPQLAPDERKHVFCRHGELYVHFAVYRSTGEKDAARAFREQLHRDADELAPGVQQPMRTVGGHSKAAGSYVEYAFMGGDDRAMCGLWWDRDDRSAALYVEAPCADGLGGRWEPLRDLWQRYG